MFIIKIMLLLMKLLLMSIKQLWLDFKKSLLLIFILMIKVNLESIWLIELKNVANKIIFKTQIYKIKTNSNRCQKYH